MKKFEGISCNTKWVDVNLVGEHWILSAKLNVKVLCKYAAFTLLKVNDISFNKQEW